MDLREKKALLRALHHEDRPLILPNAWDVASARALVAAGFPAIATASHAVAGSLGYEDGEGAPAEEMFAAAGRITRSVDVPVSVDAEAGYGLDGPRLAERLAAAGAAGCNVEDTVPAHRAEAAGASAAPPEPGGVPVRLLADVKRQAELIAALHEADPDLVINARDDAFASDALPGAPDEQRFDEAVTRARAYLDAGADVVYLIGVADEALIRRLVERVPGPINVMYRPGVPSLARLGELGVGRVTFGPGLHAATLKTLEGLAGRLRAGENPY